MRRIVLIILNVRSAHNVGAMIRSAEALGVQKIYICGYSPYPEAANDQRLPHIRQRAARAIEKTALGAQQSMAWEYAKDARKCLAGLAKDGFVLAALEQTASAADLTKFKAPDRIALLVGNEVTGVDSDLLARIKLHLQIPMLGRKESLNVSSAAAIALYHLRFF